jgi:hypothetical protein
MHIHAGERRNEGLDVIRVGGHVRIDAKLLHCVISLELVLQSVLQPLVVALLSLDQLLPRIKHLAGPEVDAHCHFLGER